MNYQRTTLQNGLRLLTIHMPEMRSVSMAFYFSVGSRHESDALAGVSHFIEHMLFKGSRLYPTARAISEAIEGVGGIFNASTGKELTCYTARVPSEYFPQILSVMADMVRFPLFDQVEVEKERGVIIEELSATQDDPQEWVNLLIDETMWPDLPLGRDDAGSIASVSALRREQMLDYFRTFYRPNTCILSIAGNIDTISVTQQVKTLFGDWEAQDILRWKPCPPPLHVPPVRMIKKATEQTNICLATLGTSYLAPDYYIFLIMNALLGDGMSSRLFQTIREEQGLAYDIGSYFNSYQETGSLVISAGVDPSRTEQAIAATVNELNRLSSAMVPDDELARIKAYLRGSMILGLEGTQQVASWLGSQECSRHSIQELDEIVALIDAVTPQDIQRVAQTCFAPEWRRLAIIGPDSPRRAEDFGKLLSGV